MSRQPFIRRILRGLFGSKSAIEFPEFLYRPTDNRSIVESAESHSSYLTNSRPRKSFFTSDYKTIKEFEDVLVDTQKARADGSDPEFFEHNIFSQPPQSTSETGSIKIKICDIGNFPECKRKFEENKAKRVMVCVGGPAAEDQAVLSKIIDTIDDKLDYIVYLTRSYQESNVNHAAKQSHARHGNALNADPSLTGHALMPTILLRALIGVTPEEAIEPDFKKIDVPFTIDPRKLRIFFKNELNYLKQKYKSIAGDLTEHDINRLESVLSQEIMAVVEKESGIELSGKDEASMAADGSSIHVSFTERNARAVEHENEEFAKVGIDSEELKPDDVAFFFGDDGKKHIHSAWRYKEDTHVKFDAHDKNRAFAADRGVKWIEGEEVERILVTRTKDGNAKFAGILTKSGEYIYGSDSHFTLGYKAEYVFDSESESREGASLPRRLLNRAEDVLGLQPPLASEITTSTGVSVNALFRKSDRMKRVIEKYGSTGEIAVTNSHWTMIAQNENFVAMRITGGGYTGSEEYNPAYFLNVMANTRRIFGDDLVGVLSAYGCPRSINPRNSTEFVKLADGLVVSYGKGGTGNTKRHAEAVTALMMTGFEPEVVDYFNRFQAKSGKPLGDQIAEIHKHLLDVEFIHDHSKRTKRRMGYDDSFSSEEAMAIGGLLVAASLALAKKQKKSSSRVELADEEDDIEKKIGETGFLPTGFTQLLQQEFRERGL